jgi:hypothetical protein
VVADWPGPYGLGMASGMSTSLAGWKDGRQWRVGTDADVAWIRESTGPGLAITSAIPPVFAAYATIVVPDTDEGRAS